MEGSETQFFTRMAPERNSGMRNLAKKLLPQKSTQIEANIALFGSRNVGKTTIAKTLGRSLYQDCDFKPELVELYQAEMSGPASKQHHKLSIFDTTGSYRKDYPSMYRKTIADCQAFILVFSLEDRSTLEEVKLVYNDILEVKQQERVPILIVANEREEKRKSESDETRAQNRSELRSELAACPYCLYREYTPSVKTSSLDLYKSIQCLLTLIIDQ